jgi:hypothetical protein
MKHIRRLDKQDIAFCVRLTVDIVGQSWNKHKVNLRAIVARGHVPLRAF